MAILSRREKHICCGSFDAWWTKRGYIKCNKCQRQNVSKLLLRGVENYSRILSGATGVSLGQWSWIELQDGKTRRPTIARNDLSCQWVGSKQTQRRRKITWTGLKGFGPLPSMCCPTIVSCQNIFSWCALKKSKIDLTGVRKTCCDSSPKSILATFPPNYLGLVCKNYKNRIRSLVI